MTPSNQPTAARSEQSLFDEAGGGGMGVLAALTFVLCTVLVFGGFYLMSLSFSYPEYGIELFLGGLFADVIGFLLALTNFTKK